jgi:hypothetical protein
MLFEIPAQRSSALMGILVLHGKVQKKCDDATSPYCFWQQASTCSEMKVPRRHQSRMSYL